MKRSKIYRINISPIPWLHSGRKGSRLYEGYIRDSISFLNELSQQHNNEPFFTQSVHVEVTFYMHIPKTTQKKNLHGNYHFSPPYLDNLYRYLINALKDIVVVDDRVICSLSLKKVYDKEPRTELTITEV